MLREINFLLSGNMDRALLRIVLVLLFLLVINGSVHAQVQLRRKFVGQLILGLTLTYPLANPCSSQTGKLPTMCPAR